MSSPDRPDNTSPGPGGGTDDGFEVRCVIPLPEPLTMTMPPAPERTISVEVYERAFEFIQAHEADSDEEAAQALAEMLEAEYTKADEERDDERGRIVGWLRSSAPQGVDARGLADILDMRGDKELRDGWLPDRSVDPCVQAGRRLGAAEEREAVCQWLRDTTKHADVCRYPHDIAGDIEDGEHRK